jgi:hypothetical protein
MSMQTLLSASAGGQYRTLESVYADLVSSVNELRGKIIKDKETAVMTQDGVSLPYLKFLIEYPMHGKTFKRR